MDKDELLAKLDSYQARIIFDVRTTLQDDYDMGAARWYSWHLSFQRFLEANLPAYSNRLKNILSHPPISGLGITRLVSLERTQIGPSFAFLKSLILDIQSDDYSNFQPSISDRVKTNNSLDRKAFIVHGHDEATKFKIARFLEKLGFDPIILHEQVNGGKTIIEKLEHFTDVGFGIVLYTPDDMGEAVSKKDQLQPRARQNVVFEHGLLIGKLMRERVFPLVTDHTVELPSDISGMVYLSDRNWEIDLAREIKSLGYEVDLNSLFN
ncbi:putative nucleotide-binding protein [Acinetobacter baylyi]|uniref:Nucleotide-binding protein n=1 Tax=Acinetobacter baylyi TaxID=202950 RepID=A0ABU0UZ25_ACIBI|nr:nucleotide-binding protein [Acinetobacter baylyi]MDQ1209774.1 putative nucleotide-binding protein [Acinetobacter baylyi]MDR6106629.1 putative nucleotide-binding protein [Acinetobacter baylyi]MDR6186643.1 putative nucleotide-binding protein [Acinetobacter baylyi]